MPTKTTLRSLLAAILLAGLLVSGPRASAEEAPSQAERVEVGQQAPPISLSSSAGETYTLGDLRGDKNLILIFFRGSW